MSAGGIGRGCVQFAAWYREAMPRGRRARAAWRNSAGGARMKKGQRIARCPFPAATAKSYGNSVIERIENWWTRLDDKSCQEKVKTFYGTPPMHQLFERSTWHSAQHTRQMIAVLERFGIEPDVRLTAEDLAGLPLPEGIWE